MIGVCTADNSLESNYLGSFDKTWSYSFSSGDVYWKSYWRKFG